MKNFLKKLFTKENAKKFFKTFAWLGILLFIIDIVSKWVVLKHFGVSAMNMGIGKDNGAIPVINNFLYIGGAINPYIAYSFHLFESEIANRITNAIISIVMSVGFTWYFVKSYKKLNSWTKAALILIIAGGFGNMIDRCFYWNSTVGFSGVIDWIQIYIKDVPIFGSFNIADSCLVIGIIILLVILIVEEVKETIAKGKNGEYKYSPEELKEKNETNKGN